MQAVAVWDVDSALIILTYASSLYVHVTKMYNIISGQGTAYVNLCVFVTSYSLETADPFNYPTLTLATLVIVISLFSN